MILLKYKSDLCGYCGACVGLCPAHILSLDFMQISILEGCVECGNCVFVCPVGAMQEYDWNKQFKMNYDNKIIRISN